jgi:trk system potassium uptake protein TrkH
MSTMGFFESWFHALFQSVSARTAGFNTIDFTAISDFGLFVIICLMLIGGSPGSTAGGMKTTTVGIAVMTLRAHLVGRDDVELFQRRIRKETVQRSFLIIFLMLLLIGVAFVILRAGQLYNPTMEIATGERKFVLMPLGFETVSAACTVGMSAGFTDRLTGMGKLVVVVLMFAGRIGPLTLALALVSREAKVNYRLPYEEVMVG